MSEKREKSKDWLLRSCKILYVPFFTTSLKRSGRLRPDAGYVGSVGSGAVSQLWWVGHQGLPQGHPLRRTQRRRRGHGARDHPEDSGSGFSVEVVTLCDICKNRRHRMTYWKDLESHQLSTPEFGSYESYVHHLLLPSSCLFMMPLIFCVAWAKSRRIVTGICLFVQPRFPYILLE